MKSSRAALLIASLCMVLGACTSTPIAPPAPVTQADSRPVAPTPPPAAKPPVVSERVVVPPTVPTVTLPAHLDAKSALSAQRSVFFAYDDFSIAKEYSAMLERHGQYLVANPRLSIKIEGNADERGGSEYNLALGQKRADAVRQALKLLGVKDAQMEAISWGKERPRATGHDEAAWTQNRRADLQYPDR